MRNVGVITTSRADYGIYFPILKRIAAHPQLRLMLFVTGAHLSAKFGRTIRFIQKDGFRTTARVPISLESDSPSAIARAMGECTRGFGKVFEKFHPGILLVLGDRYEMHAAALAAGPFNIPLAHLHGGELTYGAMDENFRHSLTKLSHLHFAATREYARRIIQMGEEPWRVRVTGAPGLDNVMSVPPYLRRDLTQLFGVDEHQPIMLVTFHPVTLEESHTAQSIRSLLGALNQFKEYQIIFTGPNADPDGNLIREEIHKFCAHNPQAKLVTNFGTRGYLSLLRHSEVMVGNSSSGIIEAASFQLPVVNIGTRQQGRIRGANVIDVGYGRDEIVDGIKRALSTALKRSLNGLVNPYGNGRASQKVVQTLATIRLEKLIPKKFYEKKN